MAATHRAVTKPTEQVGEQNGQLVNGSQTAPERVKGRNDDLVVIYARRIHDQYERPHKGLLSGPWAEPRWFRGGGESPTTVEPGRPGDDERLLIIADIAIEGRRVSRSLVCRGRRHCLRIGERHRLRR